MERFSGQKLVHTARPGRSQEIVHRPFTEEELEQENAALRYEINDRCHTISNRGLRSFWDIVYARKKMFYVMRKAMGGDAFAQKELKAMNDFMDNTEITARELEQEALEKQEYVMRVPYARRHKGQ